MSALQDATLAYSRIKDTLSPTTRQLIGQRLQQWHQQQQQRERITATPPALVMRPGLPPRPLNQHYFTVIQTYD